MDHEVDVPPKLSPHGPLCVRSWGCLSIANSKAGSERRLQGRGMAPLCEAHNSAFDSAKTMERHGFFPSWHYDAGPQELVTLTSPPFGAGLEPQCCSTAVIGSKVLS